jgi:hypothetical protein
MHRDQIRSSTLRNLTCFVAGTDSILIVTNRKAASNNAKGLLQNDLRSLFNNRIQIQNSENLNFPRGHGQRRYESIQYIPKFTLFSVLRNVD